MEALEMDLHNATIRIQERDEKIERQAKIITRLERSRKTLKERNNDFLEAMRSENMPCPYCHGTISVKEFHAEYCPLYSRSR